MKFNLKKQAECLAAEKRLKEQRDDQGTHAHDPKRSLQDLLSDVRTNDKKDPKAVESLLADARTGKDLNKTLESQIEDREVPEGIPARTGDDKHDQLPINLLGEVRDKERARAFRNASDEDTKKWDAILGAEPEQPQSQLQNHPDRFKRLTDKDVLKNKNVRQMVMASLQDADAMLYFIYRQSAGRSLTEKEQQLVDGITADKMRLARLALEKNDTI